MEQEEISPEKDEAQKFLTSLLNKNLRIHTTDTRMFRGEFKCTDPVRSPHARSHGRAPAWVEV